jgi:hypothetical protein
MSEQPPEKKRKKSGPQRGTRYKEVSWDIVTTAVKFDATANQVLAALADKGQIVSHDTLVRIVKEKTGMNFADFKEQNTDIIRLGLKKRALAMALQGDRAMLIFCLKNLCKWSDRVEHQHHGDAIKINLGYDPNLPTADGGAAQTIDVDAVSVAATSVVTAGEA